jgi:hypothetical protein
MNKKLMNRKQTQPGSILRSVCLRSFEASRDLTVLAVRMDGNEELNAKLKPCHHHTLLTIRDREVD